jgi:hypothetical protein
MKRNRRLMVGLILGLVAPALVAAGEDGVSGFVDRMVAGLKATPVDCPEGASESGWSVTCAVSDLKPKKLKSQWNRLIAAEADSTEWLRTTSGWSTHGGQLRTEHVYAGTPIVVLADAEGPDLRIAAMDVRARCGDRDSVEGRPLYRVELDDVATPERTSFVKPEVVTGRPRPGTFTARVLILRDGSVGGLCPLTASALTRQEQTSIVDAVAQWKYAPAVKDGEPVDVVWTLVLEYE